MATVYKPYSAEQVRGIQGSLDKTHGKDATPNLYIEVERRLLATIALFMAALEMIKTHEGGVCANFELCHHEGCNSSYSSWAIADAALTGVLLPVIAHEKTGDE